MPAADVSQDPLCLRRFRVRVRVVMMAQRGVAKPGKPHKALALREHVSDYASLTAGESVHQQVGLQLRDPRIVLHITADLRLRRFGIFRRQARDRPLQIAHRCQVLVHANLILLAERGVQIPKVVPNEIEYALLTLHPALFALTEQTIEEIMWDQLGRKRALIARPAHVAMNTLAMRLLTYSHLQRAKSHGAAGLDGHFGCDHVVDRRAACASSGEGRPRDQGAHRAVMVVPGTGLPRGRVVEPAEDVDVIPKRSQRRQAWRQRIIRASLFRNPVAFWDAVAVEP